MEGISMTNQEPESNYALRLKQAEIDKLEAETKALSQSHFSKPSNWLPHIVAVGKENPPCSNRATGRS
jgi:hypothetical protein